MKKIITSVITVFLMYNLFGISDEEMTKKIIKKYNLPEDIMTREEVPYDAVKKIVDERIEKEVTPEVEKKFPESMLKQVQQEANEKYPSIKKGDKITVRYRFRNAAKEAKGIYGGLQGDTIKVGNKLILIEDITDDTISKTNLAKIFKLKNKYIFEKYGTPKSEFERPLIFEIEKEEYGKAGYIYNKRVNKWVSGKKVVEALFKRIKKAESIVKVATENGEDDPLEDIKTKLPELSERVEILICPLLTDSGKVIIRGYTNLPKDTPFMLSVLSEEDGGFKDISTAKVTEKGYFESGKFGPEAGIKEGKYKVTIMMPRASKVPDSVKLVIGPRGEKLKGDLVDNSAKIGGSSVKQSKFFIVGK